MREPRNPFRLRTSENIESDATFLRLFEPGLLDVLPTEGLWDRVQIIRSAPGGGKTSLLRLFTPRALLALHANHAGDEFKELHQRARAMGAINEAGPTVLGVLLSCDRNYAALADMDLDEGRRERLFLGLLNARILLATLRAALALKRLSYPQDLRRLRANVPWEVGLPADLPLQGSGQDLHDWADRLEATVCEAMDSFGPADTEGLRGHDTLVSLALLRSDALCIDGEPVALRSALLLDDAHRLTKRQRQQLVRAVVDRRSGVGVWIAERFEALSTDELLSDGATAGRDYGGIIHLERYWRGGKVRRFEHLVLSLADRRAHAAPAVDIGSFGACLRLSLEDPRWDPMITSAADEVATHVRRLANGESRFREWVAARELIGGAPWERAVAWRALQILIERERRKTQLMFDWALSVDQLEDKDNSAVNTAAELFLANEFSLPYYFGSARLAALASSNIEQFLALAGDEFEEVTSAALLKRPTDLSPERQEAILRKAVAARWEELPRRVRNGDVVRAFLQAVGEFSKQETYLPNAPYSPGVTGIAISMADSKRLRDPDYRRDNPDHGRLAEVLATALAYNLLEPIPNHKNKGVYWMVFNLNRLLCVQFGLPLQYGGWREKSLRELCRWLDNGFRPTRRIEDRL